MLAKAARSGRAGRQLLGWWPRPVGRNGEVLLEGELLVDLGIDGGIKERRIAGAEVEIPRLGLAEARGQEDLAIALAHGLRLQLLDDAAGDGTAVDNSVPDDGTKKEAPKAAASETTDSAESDESSDPDAVEAPVAQKAVTTESAAKKAQ